MTKSCFVISAIGKNASKTRAYADEKFDLIFKPILEELGYKVTRSDKITSPGSVSREIVENLIKSDLVVADVSTENPNVFYELAIRNAVKKPVIVFKRQHQILPFDISDTRAISVTRSDMRIWEEAKNQLRAQVQMAEKDPDKASESIISGYTFDLKTHGPKTDLDKVHFMLKDLQLDVRRLDNKISSSTPIDEIETVVPTEDLYHPFNYFVTISYGSSVPGCEAENNCYSPSKLEIKKDETVGWINEDNAAHTVTNVITDDGSSVEFDSGLLMPGTSFLHKFVKVGTFPYHDMVHPWMEGIIIVE